MAEPEAERIEADVPAGNSPRRDWVGRLLERLSRPTSSAESDEQPPRFTTPMMLALLALAVAAGVTIGLIITSGGDETKLEATLMTLELSYPTIGDPTAILDGQPKAAPDGARITCRATSDERRLGVGSAANDGSFALVLDAGLWPLESISGDAYASLNSTLECRAGSGPWVQPLRPPRVAIN